MVDCRITAVRKTEYRDLMDCLAQLVGDVWTTNGCERPDGFCESAWESILPFVKVLSEGGGNFFDGWMKDEHSAMVSCNDGFRPVSFYIEAIKGSKE